MLDTKTMMIFLPFLGACLIGLNYAINEKAFTGISLSTYTIIYCVIAILVALLIHIFTPEKIDFSALTYKPVVKLIVLSILASTFAWMITIFAIKHVSADYTAAAEISYPFFTVLFGYLIFNRHIDWSTAIGALLVMVGSVVLIVGKIKTGR
jgi:drug/metabolite transporter (DMT)-like permease